jgi:UDP-N-acetylmuramyl pentapeptide phosphotransferase/UDP-N-acetylglucosamine-1-phosphate transferase
MRILGFALIVVGLVALLYGGISWTKRDKVVDVGPIEVTRENHERLPIPPIAGGLVLVAGVVLVVMRRKGA